MELTGEVCVFFRWELKSPVKRKKKKTWWRKSKKKQSMRVQIRSVHQLSMYQYVLSQLIGCFRKDVDPEEKIEFKTRLGESSKISFTVPFLTVPSPLPPSTLTPPFLGPPPRQEHLSSGVSLRADWEERALPPWPDGVRGRPEWRVHWHRYTNNSDPQQGRLPQHGGMTRFLYSCSTTVPLYCSYGNQIVILSCCTDIDSRQDLIDVIDIAFQRCCECVVSQ